MSQPTLKCFVDHVNLSLETFFVPPKYPTGKKEKHINHNQTSISLLENTSGRYLGKEKFEGLR